jgi:cytochrome P450
VQFSKPRYVRRNTNLGGIELKEGETIMVMIAGANMDPKANEAPEKLDLERHPNRHIAFGTGIHFCLGYQLARIEGKCALRALFARWPNLELAIEPAQIRWRPHPGLKAIETLPVAAHP